MAGLKLQAVTKSWDNGKTQVIQPLTLDVADGEFIVMVGPSGCGKSTLGRLLVQLEAPTEGTVEMEGRVVKAGEEMRRLRRDVQIVFQDPYTSLNPRMTVGDIVAEPLLIHKKELDLKGRERDRVKELLDQVGLADMADEVTVNLPYGRKRALEIATTLAMEPELMLLDEPTQGMGHEDVDRVTQLIKKVSAGRTILMVEHNMKVISTIADRITVLQRGSVLAEGPYEEVSKNPQVLEAYVGSDDMNDAHH